MSRVIHANELAAIRDWTDGVTPGQVTDREASRVIRELLDHIEAMRTHRCIFRWSDVKVAKAGGPPATCRFCGLPPSPNDVADQRFHADCRGHWHTEVGGVMATVLGTEPSPNVLVRDPVTGALTPYSVTVADGVRGMERGR